MVNISTAMTVTATCGVSWTSCDWPTAAWKTPCRPIGYRMRAPAFMQDRAREKKLIIAPMEMGTFSQPTPFSSASVFSGAASWSSVVV